MLTTGVEAGKGSTGGVCEWQLDGPDIDTMFHVVNSIKTYIYVQIYAYK